MVLVCFFHLCHLVHRWNMIYFKRDEKFDMLTKLKSLINYFKIKRSTTKRNQTEPNQRILFVNSTNWILSVLRVLLFLSLHECHRCHCKNQVFSIENTNLMMLNVFRNNQHTCMHLYIFLCKICTWCARKHINWIVHNVEVVKRGRESKRVSGI